MKILHINDLAGVGYILVKYLRKAGHQADLISWMDDKAFGFSDFYKGRKFQDPDIMMHILAGIIPNYDILHVHFPYQLLSQLYKFNKPIVYHAHGTEIATETMEVRITAQKAEGIIVAGEQLLQYHPRAKYLPTIVDTEHFYPMSELRKYGNFIFDIHYLDTLKAFNESGVHPIIVNRNTDPVQYSELPKFLNQFAGFIDTRYHIGMPHQKPRGLLTDMSKTGLEALACGLKVYHMGEWKEGLPERHKPENVVVQLLKYYEEILN